MRQNLRIPAEYAPVVQIYVIIRQTSVCFKTLIITIVSYYWADASNPAQPRHILQKVRPIDHTRLKRAISSLRDHELGRQAVPSTLLSTYDPGHLTFSVEPVIVRRARHRALRHCRARHRALRHCRARHRAQRTARPASLLSASLSGRGSPDGRAPLLRRPLWRAR